jgi:hypothetical protein
MVRPYRHTRLAECSPQELHPVHLQGRRNLEAVWAVGRRQTELWLPLAHSPPVMRFIPELLCRGRDAV